MEAMKRKTLSLFLNRLGKTQVIRAENNGLLVKSC